MKKATCLTIVMALMAFMTSAACAFEAGRYIPGSYAGEAEGYSSVVEVVVTTDDSSIIDVQISGDGEKEIGMRAVDELPASILASQSYEFDAISGATVTSEAIREAFVLALSQAVDESAQMASISFEPGTYEGVGMGYSGPITCEVTFSPLDIEAIEVLTQSDSEMGLPAFETLIPDIIVHTSTGVDVVSGATVTSRGILAAVEDAASQAGCDLEALRGKAIPVVVR